MSLFPAQENDYEENNLFNVKDLNQELKKISRNFQELKKITPEDLGINKQYCLNITTLIYQEEILTKKFEEIDTKQISDDELVDIDFEKKKIGILLDIVRDNKKKYHDMAIGKLKKQRLI